jgi:hypothetical protein
LTIEDKTLRTPVQPSNSVFRSGALGVGLVLVALPMLLLFAGADHLEKVQMVGLPLLAIFGIMILFGSLALVAMLFESLNLTNPEQPLALPEGSIRAAIALSLIVLFAIISILLFKSSAGAPFELGGMTEAQRNDIVAKSADRVQKIADAPCAKVPAAGANCGADDRRFVVTLRSGVSSESTDLAKQLLILVGTLMTSVTSYYFASRAQSSATDAATAKSNPPSPAPVPALAPAPVEPEPDAHVDGCDVAIDDPTPDHALPAARGGVAEAPAKPIA